MTVTSATAPTSNLEAARLATPGGAAEPGISSDRFLKLLVTQMQNQDPLNPMDNAQVTSQMAQINTVSGIEKLNASVQGLSAQFVQLQALQGAALIGREVTVPGSRLSVADGVGKGGFSLTSPADAVQIEVLNGAGHVVDTLALGAQGAGSHRFNWDASKAPADSELRFRVVATSGSTPLSTTALMQDRVSAVQAGGSSLTLELARSGAVAYSDVKSFH